MPSKAFDATEAALAKMQREGQRSAADARYRQLKGLPSATEEAQQRLAEKQRAAEARVEQAAAQRRQQAFAGAARQFGQAGIAAAVGSPLGAAASVAGGFAELGGAGGILSIVGPIGIAATAVTGFAKAVGTAASSIVERGRELRAYSPVLAQANAMADVRGVLTDIKEARMFGDDYAELTETWSKFKSEWQLHPAKKYVAKAANWVLKHLQPKYMGGALGVHLKELPEDDDGSDVFGEVTDATKQQTAFWQKQLENDRQRAIWNQNKGGTLEDVARDMARLRELAEQAELEKHNPLLAQFFELGDFASQGGQLRRGDPIRRAAQQQLNIPAFSGLS